MRASDQGFGRPAIAWAFYDLAYSLFTFTLVARYLPDWIINDHGRPDWYVSVTQVAVVLVVLVFMPVAGALADLVGRRKPFLVAFTLVGAGAGAVLAILDFEQSVLLVLVVAAISVASAQLAFAQYDPLLAAVAPPRSYGRVSGLAVALGFAGIIIAIGVIAEGIVGDGSKQRAFAPAAALYVLFALPAFVLVRESPHRRAVTREAVREARGHVLATLRRAGSYPYVYRFLGGRLLYSEAITTLTAFLAVYMTRLGGFSERDKNVVFGVAVLAAAIGAIVGGRLVERRGPRMPLLGVLPVFAAATLLSALIGKPWTIWLAAPVAGVALGVVWTADRVFMLRLTPAELRGQFFGFFNLANRVAAAIGPLLIWAGTIWILHDLTGAFSKLGASRVALAGLAFAALAGWAVIRGIPGGRASDESSEHEPGHGGLAVDRA